MQPTTAAPAAPAAAPQGNPAKAAIQRLVMAAQKIAYSPNTSDQLLNMIQNAPDIVSGVAQAALVILDQMNQQVKGLKPQTVYTIAGVVVGMLLEQAEAAGLVKFDPKLVPAATKAVFELMR